MPQMTPVYSSNVKAIGHDPDSNELHVEWGSGKVSIYEGVPAKLASEVQNAWSVGQAVNSQIKDNFPHRYAK
jgi:hypothetical protein